MISFLKVSELTPCVQTQTHTSSPGFLIEHIGLSSHAQSVPGVRFLFQAPTKVAGSGKHAKDFQVLREEDNEIRFLPGVALI